MLAFRGSQAECLGIRQKETMGNSKSIETHLRGHWLERESHLEEFKSRCLSSTSSLNLTSSNGKGARNEIIHLTYQGLRMTSRLASQNELPNLKAQIIKKIKYVCEAIDKSACSVHPFPLVSPALLVSNTPCTSQAL